MRLIYLIESVELETVKPLVRILDAAKPDAEPFCLKICTGGGDILAMYALIASMRTCAVPVNTFGVGEVASAGIDILAAGHFRQVHPLVLGMTHRASAGMAGKRYASMEDARSKEVYAGKTKILAHWAGLFGRRDRYHTAGELVDFGFADAISEMPTEA